MNSTEAKQIIDILEKTQGEIKEIAGEKNISFNIRISSVFNSLINSMKHTLTGASINPQTNTEMKFKPITSVFGQKVSENKMPTGKRIEQSIENKPEFNAELKKFRAEVDAIIETLNSRNPKEVLESVSELHLKAIGKRLEVAYRDVEVNTAYVISLQEKLAAQTLEAAKKEELKGKIDIQVTEQHLEDEDVQEGEIVQIPEEGMPGPEDEPTEPVEEMQSTITNEESERQALIAEYEKVVGKKPHPATGIEKLKEAIEKAKAEA